MADPFDVRMRFTTILHHLNASVTSAQKAAVYALRNRDMDEDLHSCILEQLEKNNMNNRANIMYFIEHLCDQSQRENHMEFVRMIQRDILRIIDAVAPSDGSGAANVKVVRRVLNGLQQRQVLQPDTVRELEACLKERDVSDAHPAMSDDGPNNAPSKTSTPHGGKANGVARLDKRQIEQRIEEDRERHKRLRESIWAVSGEEGDEFEKIFQETMEVDQDDLADEEEDQNERLQILAFA